MEPRPQLVSALWALRRRLVEAPCDERVERLGNVGAKRAKRWRRIDHDARERRCGVLPMERRSARKKLEDDRAQRPNVGARIDPTRVAYLLRGHVGWRTEHLSGRRNALIGRVGRLGDAEVEHLHERRPVRPMREKEVRGLEVAVDDAETMRVGNRNTRLRDVVDGLRHGKRALSADAPEIGAVDVFHDEERLTARQRAEIADPRDVLAFDARGRPCFAEEPRDVGWLHGERSMEELQRHDLAELNVRRTNDDAHAALPEHFVDAVLSRDDRARRREGGVRSRRSRRHAKGVLAERIRETHASDQRVATARRVCAASRLYVARERD